MFEKKIQKSGNNSLNLQSENININMGLTYADVRQIIWDIFQANFLELSQEAANIASNRAIEIIDQYLKKLSEKDPNLLNSAKDPDMQYAIFTAQKEYARTGDKDLGELLVDILVDRAAENERSIMQIVLNEALSIAPKLTIEQYNVLSLVYIVKYTRQLGLTSLDDFSAYIKKSILTFTDNFRFDRACFQHLEYAGCGSFSNEGRVLNSPVFARRFKSTYPGLFWRGANHVEIEELLQINRSIETFLMRCLHNPDLFQFALIDTEDLKDECQEKGFDDALTRRLISFQNTHLFTDGEANKKIVDMVPEARDFIHIWNDSLLDKFNLTSVGIAIGHANMRRRTGQEYNLNIWIK